MNNSLLILGFLLLIVLSGCGPDNKTVEATQACDGREYLGLKTDYPETEVWFENIRFKSSDFDLKEEPCLIQKLNISTDVKALYDRSSTDSDGYLKLSCPAWPMSCFDQSLFDYLDLREMNYGRNQFDSLEINFRYDSAISYRNFKYWELK